MNQSEHINELVTALVAAQGDIEHATKNSINPHFRNNYANLEAVIDAVRDAFTKHGLVVMQPTAVTDQGPVVVTIVAHKSGQFIQGETPIINSKGDAQGMGSAISYARRYSLAAMANITQADDDGNDASGKSAPKALPKKATKGPTPEEF
jgi:hypothetical protein